VAHICDISDSHSGEYEDDALIGYSAVYSRLSRSTFCALFLVYLTIHFRNEDYRASNESVISSDELDRVWKEEVVA